VSELAELWRYRDVRLYISGQILSEAADLVLILATGLWTRTLTGSDSAAALTFSMLALGGLAGPLGGVAVDRLRRRSVLVAANLGTACVVTLLLFVHGSGELWLIYLVMLVYGVSGTLIGPARGALLTNVVPEKLLPEANTVLATAAGGMRLVAPLLGTGILVTFGAAPLILGDAASFGVAVLTLLAISATEDLPVPSRPRLLNETAAGVRHISAIRPLRRLTRAAIVSVAACGLAETGIFVVVLSGLHKPTSFVSVFVTVQGIGAIASGLAAAKAVRRMGELRAVGLGLFLLAAAFLLLAVPGLFAVLAGGLLLGASLPLLGVGANTLLQRRTPDLLLGRAFAAYDLLLSVPQTAAIAAGAAVFTPADFHLLFALLALCVLGAACSLVPREIPEQHAAGTGSSRRPSRRRQPVDADPPRLPATLPSPEVPGSPGRP
jgi:MFS family permease